MTNAKVENPFDFLVKQTQPDALPNLAQPTEEQRLVVENVRAFMDAKVMPRVDELEEGNTKLLLELFSAASELGLLGLEIPEEYGGLGLSFTTAMMVAAELARQASFSTAMGAHFGIGTLPLVLFGSDALKKRYLPELASGKRIGAYALTEPEAGSDALGAKTRATRQPNGDFVLDGAKQFITNAGVAGLYTVFAKVDGEAFTAFLVPAETKGVSAGAPEKKMGLRGSLTASVMLEGARIPADHILGEIGGGHRVAFNILNVGRMKLGFGSMGYARAALRAAASYAAERRQFGKAIAEFGLIRTRLSDMAARIAMLEGACFRVAQAMDDNLHGGIAASSQKDVIAVLKKHAVAGAIVKVLGSEYLGFIADDAVQIHGGYGFIEEYEVCRIYRDVRVNRIFEGTNEVNRLLVASGLFKEGMMGAWDMPSMLGRASQTAPRGTGVVALCETIRWVLGNFFQAAMNTFGPALEHEQVVLGGLSDLVMELFALDSGYALLGTKRGDSRSVELRSALLGVAAEAARGRVISTVTQLASRLCIDRVGELTAPIANGASDVKDHRECVAKAVLERGGPV